MSSSQPGSVEETVGEPPADAVGLPDPPPKTSDEGLPVVAPIPEFKSGVLGADLQFAPTKEPVIRLGFAGDVLLHRRIQRQASWKRGYGHLFGEVEGLISSFDMMYANLEGPTAMGLDVDGNEVEDPGLKFDEVVYTSFPRFNYHPKIISDLLDAGVDVVSTANNHSMDRDAEGINRTIDALDKAGMPYTGTRKHDRRRDVFYTIQNVQNLKIALLACTYGVGGPSDKFHQVNYCFRDRKTILETLPVLRAEADFIVVLPHWGDEYSPDPNEEQRRVAKEFLEAGADAVVGAHPHVLQPWEGYLTKDGRKTVIMHSLGNFVSNQRELERRSSVVFNLDIVRDGQDVRIAAVGVYPIMTVIRKHVLEVIPLNDREAGAEEWDHVFSMFPAQALRTIPVVQNEAPNVAK
jgi:hypothetical protein